MPDDSQDWHSWQRLRTGKATASSGPSFVRATKLSKRWGEVNDAETPAEGEAAREGEHEDDDDIFSSPIAPATDKARTIRGDQRSTLHVSPQIASQEEEQSMSSFYAGLARDMPIPTATPPPSTSTSTAPSLDRDRERERGKRMGIKRHHESLKKEKEDWFIEKARQRLMEQAISQGASNSRSSKTTPTIAQLLASTEPVSIVPASSKESYRAPNAKVKLDDNTILALKPGNLGYAALERMGWRIGMGLGRDEFEWANSSGLLHTQGTPLGSAEADGRHFTAEARNIEHGAEKGEDKIAPVDTVIISDDEDNGEGTEEDGDGWLENIVAQKEREESMQSTRSSRPDGEMSGSSEVTQSQARSDSAPPSTVSENEASAQIPRDRPRMTPLSLHVRPDRRGVGVSLPSSSRVRDLPHEISQYRRNHSTLRHRELESQGRRTRRTKKQRSDDIAREKEDWRALRSSLR